MNYRMEFIMRRGKIMTDGAIARRELLKKAGMLAGTLLSLPLVSMLLRSRSAAKETAEKKKQAVTLELKGHAHRYLLKNGLIVDGTGKKAYTGNVVIDGDILGVMGPGEVSFSGETIDCTGLAVAPGIIDMHSHMDWILPYRDHPRLAAPFTRQGVTTFIGGQCGYGIAAYSKKTAHRAFIQRRAEGMFTIDWRTLEEYYNLLGRRGISHNLMNCIGYGTTRASMRAFEPSPLKPEEMKEMLYLLEEAMDQGACGVSFGLQYEPGVFATRDEILQIARLVKRKDKIITVHLRAYSALSGTYPIKLFGKAHNLMALDEMIDITRETGVRMQISHLIFVGAKTFKTCDDALERIDTAIKGGMDIRFDTYAYHCGTSIINVFLPAWFLAKAPGAFDDPVMLRRLRKQIRLITFFLGFGYKDIQITDGRHPDLVRYNGMFLSEIARARKADEFETYIYLAKTSNGRARVLNHRYSSLDNVKDLMRHPASLFMTDASPALEGVQNPAVYGNFPLFFQYARDFKLISLEEAVRKMSGASAERFKIKNRGLLKTGYTADVMVFDPRTVRDNNTLHKTDRTPSGIHAVFMNGRPVYYNGKVDLAARAGRVITV